MSEIKFVWNGSFAGRNHSMIINDVEITLGGIVSNPEESKKEAIRILKEDWNIDYDPTKIEFKWGGRL